MFKLDIKSIQINKHQAKDAPYLQIRALHLSDGYEFYAGEFQLSKHINHSELTFSQTNTFLPV